MRSTPILTILALVIIVGLGLYYFLGTDTSSTTNQTDNGQVSVPTTTDTSTSATTSTTSATSTAKEVEVDIRSFAYSPAALTVERGTKVTWTNYDTAPHTVTSVSGTLLDSPRLAKGESFSFIFNSAGAFDYYCTIHPNMKASVIVK